MKIFSVILAVVSLSGWGLFFYSMHGRSEAERSLAQRVASQLEYKRSLEDSLKQQVELSKRNALFIKEQEFEHKLEDMVAQFREQLVKEAEERIAAAQSDFSKRQEELDKRHAEFRGDLERKSGKLQESLAAELGQKAGRQELEDMALAQGKRLEGHDEQVRKLQESSIVQERLVQGLRQEQEALIRETGRLKTLVKELEDALRTTSADISALRQPPVKVVAEQ